MKPLYLFLFLTFLSFSSSILARDTASSFSEKIEQELDIISLFVKKYKKATKLAVATLAVPLLVEILKRTLFTPSEEFNDAIEASNELKKQYRGSFDELQTTLKTHLKDFLAGHPQESIKFEARKRTSRFHFGMFLFALPIDSWYVSKYVKFRKKFLLAAIQ